MSETNAKTAETSSEGADADVHPEKENLMECNYLSKQESNDCNEPRKLKIDGTTMRILGSKRSATSTCEGETDEALDSVERTIGTEVDGQTAQESSSSVVGMPENPEHVSTELSPENNDTADSHENIEGKDSISDNVDEKDSTSLLCTNIVTEESSQHNERDMKSTPGISAVKSDEMAPCRRPVKRARTAYFIFADEKRSEIQKQVSAEFEFTLILQSDIFTLECFN